MQIIMIIRANSNYLFKFIDLYRVNVLHNTAKVTITVSGMSQYYLAKVKRQ